MKTLILDANWMIRMNYHAMPRLTTSAGEEVGAICGFVSSLIKIIREQEPDFAIACFDRGEKLKREEMYQLYKADHVKMDDELYQQWPRAFEAVKAFGIERYELPSYEADDLIGTLSKMAEEKGHVVTIYSYDSDMYQLVTDNVTVLTPKSTVSPSVVRGRFGVEPNQVPDYKALTGDSSDNIPRFLGEATSAKLLNAYKTLGGIYEHINEVADMKTKQKLIDNEEAIRLNLLLTTIERSLPVLFPTKRHTIDEDEVIRFLKQMEFRNLLGRFEHWRLKSNVAER